MRAFEFFRMALPNDETGTRYQRTIDSFCHWMSDWGLTSIKDVQHLHTAPFIEECNARCNDGQSRFGRA